MRRHGHDQACELFPLRYPPTATFPSVEAHVDDCMDRLSLQSHFNLTYRMMCASQREVFGIVYDFELE